MHAVARVMLPPSSKATCGQRCSRCCQTCRCEQRLCSSRSAASALRSTLEAREAPNISAEPKRSLKLLAYVFPVVSTWRPKDVYGGVGQLDALLGLLRIKAQYNLAHNDEKCDAAILQRELDDMLAKIDEGVFALDKLKSAVANRKVEGFKEKIGFIVNMQTQLKTQFERNKIARDRSIVVNTKKTLSLIPSIIDYAVNIGVRIDHRAMVGRIRTKHRF